MTGDSFGAEGDFIVRAGLDPGRRIAGAVLALVGAAIALQLVRAIVANRASTHADWGAYFPVVLIFGTLSLAFLLPGALMLLYRREVRLDRENGQIVDRQTYLGYGRTRCYPLASFKTIVLARRQIKRRRAGKSVGSAHARRTYRFFVVELASGHGKPVRIVTDAKEEPARAAATRLASLTRLVVDDEVERERAREAAGLDEEDELQTP